MYGFEWPNSLLQYGPSHGLATDSRLKVNLWHCQACHKNCQLLLMSVPISLPNLFFSFIKYFKQVPVVTVGDWASIKSKDNKRLSVIQTNTLALTRKLKVLMNSRHSMSATKSSCNRWSSFTNSNRGKNFNHIQETYLYGTFKQMCVERLMIFGMFLRAILCWGTSSKIVARSPSPSLQTNNSLLSEGKCAYFHQLHAFNIR